MKSNSKKLQDKAEALLNSLGCRPRTGVVLRCKACNKKFYTKPCQKDRRRCCSKKCFGLYKRNREYIICKVCGKQYYRRPSEKVWGKTSTCSKKCMGKVMGKLRSGSNSNFWRGGVSSKNRLIRYSAKMENWRKSVFKRDNFTCQDCGRRGCYIEAHHIKSFAYYPKLRFVISNGKTLCRDCHDKTKRRKV